METVMEVFNEDRIAHPWNPHVFVVPRLMTHLWQKNLKKDADVLFTVQVRDYFWGRSKHEPLIIALMFPIVHVTGYRGPWLTAGTLEAKSLVQELECGIKYSRNRRHAGLSLLDGS